jgi:CRP/FNR family cyclic AMP-dependent transcriptional regulator
MAKESNAKAQTTARPRRSRARGGIPLDPQTLGHHPTAMDIAGLRKRSVIFAALSDEEAASLMQMARKINHPARHVVFQEGEPGDHLLVVMQGRVKVSLISPDGKEAILSILEPGDVFGEMALLDGEPRSASVTTMENCVFLVLWRRDFLPFLERNPQVALKLLAALSKRLRSTNDMVGNLSFLHLPARLARILINLGQQYGKLTAEGIAIGSNCPRRNWAIWWGCPGRASTVRSGSGWNPACWTTPMAPSS